MKKTPKSRYSEPIRVEATPEQLIQAIIHPPPKGRSKTKRDRYYPKKRR